MVIGKLKPGMTVYDVRPATGLRRLSDKWIYWFVKIIEVDYENKKVFASWNNNEPKWYYKHAWKKWRLRLPKEV